MSDELIRKYADEIERIIRDDTAGDYTWNGLLFSFLREVDESRTLKYEVEFVDDSEMPDEENRYYDIQTYAEGFGWTVFAYKLTYDNAQEIFRSFRDDAIWRLVDHGASTEEDEPEKEPELLFDVEFTQFGKKELYAYGVSYEDALVYAAEIKDDNPKIVVSEGQIENPVEAVDKGDPIKYYDVQVYKAGWWDFVRQSTFMYAKIAESQVSDYFETQIIEYDPDRESNWATFKVT